MRTYELEKEGSRWHVGHYDSAGAFRIEASFKKHGDAAARRNLLNARSAEHERWLRYGDVHTRRLV